MIRLGGALLVSRTTARGRVVEESGIEIGGPRQVALVRHWTSDRREGAWEHSWENLFVWERQHVRGEDCRGRGES